jgi:hypothetical protein
VSRNTQLPKGGHYIGQEKGEEEEGSEEEGRREKKYPDMVTIALHGDVANEIQAYMAKHEIKGAELLRRAFALLKAKTK